MHAFVYRHWDAELAFVGDWPQDATLARLAELHAALWSDSPPGPQEDDAGGARAAVASLDHPLARALTLLYHLAGQQRASGARQTLPTENAEALRQVALRVLREPPIAHVMAADAPPLLGQSVASEQDGSYVRQLALSALGELAQAADFDEIAARLGALDDPAVDDERVAAVGALVALATRAPALLAKTGLTDRLLALAQADRSVVVRVTAAQAVMKLSPTEQVCTALRDTLTGLTGTPGEAEWAIAIALFQRDPATQARLLLDIHRRSERPAEFRALYTRLELMAEEATLRLYLGRPNRPAPLIWHDADGSVFALCHADAMPPEGADDPLLSTLAPKWLSAVDDARTALLLRLAESGHLAGRTLAVLAGPAPAEDAAFPDEEQDDEEQGAQDLDAQAAAPLPDVDWLTLARRVLNDPPLTRLRASDVPAPLLSELVAGADFCLADSAESACNHRAALPILGALAEAGDADAGLMVRCFLQTANQSAPATDSSDAVLGAAIEALYWHSKRYGQPPPGAPILAAVLTLAREGYGETRRRAVQLLGRWPAAQTAELLQTLSSDPTFSVCCVADRALAEQTALPQT